MIDPRRIRYAAFVLVMMGFAILFASWDAARAADKEESKIVGKWVLSKVNGLANQGEPQQYTAYEFTKKGNMTRFVGRQSWKGTYKVKGDKLIFRFSAPRVKTVTESLTIKKLEDDVLVIVPEKPKLELEFKKKK